MTLKAEWSTCLLISLVRLVNLLLTVMHFDGVISGESLDRWFDIPLWAFILAPLVPVFTSVITIVVLNIIYYSLTRLLLPAFVFNPLHYRWWLNPPSGIWRWLLTSSRVRLRILCCIIFEHLFNYFPLSFCLVNPVDFPIFLLIPCLRTVSRPIVDLLQIWRSYPDYFSHSSYFRPLRAITIWIILWENSCTTFKMRKLIVREARSRFSSLGMLQFTIKKFRGRNEVWWNSKGRIGMG